MLYWTFRLMNGEQNERVYNDTTIYSHVRQGKRRGENTVYFLK